MNTCKARLPHRITTLILTLTLTLGLTIPVMAAKTDSPDVPAGYTVTMVTHPISTYGHHYFHNGLIALFQGDDSSWGYMDTTGKIILTQSNNAAQPYGFDFSEGLAPFINYGKLGYMDTAGKVVIPAQFEYKESMGMIYAGRFVDGNALVFQETGRNAFGTEGAWTQINKTGKTVTKTLNENSENVIYSDAQGNTAGITTETIIISGVPTELEFSEGHALLNWNENAYYIISKASSFPSVPQASVTAQPAQSNLLYNGQSVTLNAYLIDGNNYFKLRDFAAIMLTNDKQFEVTWNAEKRAIELISGKAYTIVGGELQPGKGGTETAVPNSSAIYKDGQPISLTAYTIGGNNFFKLRDLCRTFDIFVGWDGATSTVSIETGKPYSE